jgi:nicotinamide mononucleotide transporter
MADDTLLPAWLAAVSPWEALAVLLAVAYLLLAIRQNPWCWPAAILSSGLYIGLMYGARLYMESGLQVFYIAVALYGWRAWRRSGRGSPSGLAVHTWSLRHHASAGLAIAGLTAASGWLLSTYTGAAFPYLDSFTTWGALLATWMVARKVLENWLYWLVIDSVSLGLYLNRGLYLTAGLFAVYLVLIVLGYRTWRRDMGPGRRAGDGSVAP